MDKELLMQAGRKLSSWSRTMILSHERPDGDALGAIAAMKRIIEGNGKAATGFVYDELGARYQFLNATGGFTRWPANDAAGFDGILIMDTCSWSQLEPAATFLRECRVPKVIVDHHATRDDLSGGCDDVLYVIDEKAPAVCTLLYEWCQAMGWNIDPAAAEALFTGVATDTGWFRFSNTTGRALNSAAALVSLGVKPDVMHGRLMSSFSEARARLMGEMLNTLQLLADGRLAVAYLSPEMFKRCAASHSDTEDLVNEPMTVATVVASALLTDMGDGKIRVNLRSKSPEVAGIDVDVAAVAQTYGGGGHRRARPDPGA